MAASIVQSNSNLLRPSILSRANTQVARTRVRTLLVVTLGYVLAINTGQAVAQTSGKNKPVTQTLDNKNLPTVASINLCADQMVLLLAQDSQILSLSNLSHQPAGSYYYERARQYPVNEGHAEQVLKLQPDLVIAGQYSSAYTVDLLEETGLRVEILPLANDIASMLGNIKTVADWLGHKTLGDTIVLQLKSRLATLQSATAAKPIAAAFGPNGYTSGAQSLKGQMIDLAGWSNAATLAGIQQYGQLSLETIIRLQPDALIYSPYSEGTYSRAQAMTHHPALHSSGVNPHIIHVASRKTMCAGPWTIDVIEQMQAERLMLFGAE